MIADYWMMLVVVQFIRRPTSHRHKTLWSRSVSHNSSNVLSIILKFKVTAIRLHPVLFLKSRRVGHILRLKFEACAEKCKVSAVSLPFIIIQISHHAQSRLILIVRTLTECVWWGATWQWSGSGNRWLSEIPWHCLNSSSVPATCYWAWCSRHHRTTRDFPSPRYKLHIDTRPESTIFQWPGQREQQSMT